jgi:hypothetical protein
MGRACFLRVPESEANDLNFLLCRCNETGYASRLSNNEIQPMKRIELNSAMKNRTPSNPINPNLMEQRRAGRWCRCLNLALLTPKKKVAPLQVFKLDFDSPPKFRRQRIGLDVSLNQNDSARRPAGFNIV